MRYKSELNLDTWMHQPDAILTSINQNNCKNPKNSTVLYKHYNHISKQMQYNPIFLLYNVWHISVWRRNGSLDQSRVADSPFVLSLIPNVCTISGFLHELLWEPYSPHVVCWWRIQKSVNWWNDDEVELEGHCDKEQKQLQREKT